MPSYVPSDAGAWRETRHRLRIEYRARPAHAPRHHRDARSRNRRALAIVDGRYITEARTAAVSAVSVKKLARQIPASSRSSAPACRRAAISKRSRTCAISAKSAPGARRKKISTRSQARPELSRPNRPEAAVRGADVIVIAASSPTPILVQRLGRPRRACRLRRRDAPHAPGDGARTRRSRAPLRRFARRRAQGIGRRDSLRRRAHRRRIRRAGRRAQLTGRDYDFQIAGTRRRRCSRRASRSPRKERARES